MAEVLSDQWVEELVAAAGSAQLPDDGGDIVVAYEVLDGPRWWIGARAGRPVAGVGVVDDADVTFVHDAATAAALHRGDIDVQRAIADGRLRVRGDVARLRSARPVLAALAEATAPLRS